MAKIIVSCVSFFVFLAFTFSLYFTIGTGNKIIKRKDSSQIKIVKKQENNEKLKKSCKSLAENIISSGDYDKKTNQKEALRHINNEEKYDLFEACIFSQKNVYKKALYEAMKKISHDPSRMRSQWHEKEEGIGGREILILWGKRFLEPQDSMAAFLQLPYGTKQSLEAFSSFWYIGSKDLNVKYRSKLCKASDDIVDFFIKSKNQKIFNSGIKMISDARCPIVYGEIVSHKELTRKLNDFSSQIIKYDEMLDFAKKSIVSTIKKLARGEGNTKKLKEKMEKHGNHLQIAKKEISWEISWVSLDSAKVLKNTIELVLNSENKETIQYILDKNKKEVEKSGVTTNKGN